MGRTRRMSLLTPTHVSCAQSRSNGWSDNSFTLSCAGQYDGMSKEIIDVVTPRFHERVEQGEVIINDLTLHSYSRTYVPMGLAYTVPPDTNYTASYSGDCAWAVEHLVPPDVSLSADLGRMSQVALVKAFAKIKDDSVMSGEILSSLGQTLGMLRSPFRSITSTLAKMCKKAKNDYGKTARSVAKANANAWLEYRYGLLPFIADARQQIKMAQEFRARLEKRRLVVRASQIQSRKNVTRFEKRQLTNLADVWFVTGSVSVDHKVAAHAGVIYEVRDTSPAERIAADYQLGSDTLLPTLWEIVPYSFVVDWIVGVGDWLAAMNLPPGVNVLGSWVTTVDDHQAVYLSEDLEHRGYRYGVPYVHGTWGGSTIKQCGVIRTKNPSLPPMPVALNKWLSVIHSLDAAALSYQPMAGLIRKLRH